MLQFNAHAQTDKLYGLIGQHLVDVDLTTGEATEIGQIDDAYQEISGFTFEPNLQKILAVSDFKTSPKLISIDPNDASVIEIGEIYQDDPFVDLNWIESLTYNHSDGMLYGAGNENGQPSHKIFTINSQTGKANIKNYTVTNTCESGDVDGLLSSQTTSYAIDGCFNINQNQLYTIDLNNGNTSFVNSVLFDTHFLTTAINLTNGDFYLRSNDDNNKRNLFKYSITDGQITLMGEIHEENEFGSNFLSRLAFAGGSTTSTSDLEIENTTFRIYPNPTNGDFRMEFNDKLKDTEFKITNSLGQEVRGWTNANENEVSISNLPDGIYFISILKQNQIIDIKKIILKNTE